MYARMAPTFEIQSVIVKHALWPRSVAGSPRGGVTSAIDPDFKKGIDGLQVA